MSHKSPDSHINVTVECGEDEGKVSLDTNAAEGLKQPRKHSTQENEITSIENEVSKYWDTVENGYLSLLDNQYTQNVKNI